MSKTSEKWAGRKFGRWTIIEWRPGLNAKWLCRCDCGTMKEVAYQNVVYGRSKSCGCLHDITADGKTQSVPQWAAELGVSSTLIYRRLRAGQPIEGVRAYRRKREPVTA